MSILRELLKLLQAIWKRLPVHEISSHKEMTNELWMSILGELFKLKRQIRLPVYVI